MQRAADAGSKHKVEVLVICAQSQPNFRLLAFMTD